MPGNDTAALELLLVVERAKLNRALLAHQTQVGYRYDWALFSRWCGEMKREALPASTETVSLYLTDLLTKGKKVTTATRRTSAITHVHRTEGFDTPVTDEVRRLLKGAQRLRGERPKQMRPLLLPDLHSIATLLLRDGRARAIRNCAILVIGFASALRRESLAALELEDVEFWEEGIVLRIRREKQDQEGRGRQIGLPAGKRSATCPVRRLRAWLKLRGNRPGPLFTRMTDDRPLRGEAVCRIVKASVRLIGLNSRLYGGHSLRSGFITRAGECNVGTLSIAGHTGHHSLHVLRQYFRRQELWNGNACAQIGL